MDNIKVSAVFTLPGGVLPAEQPCSKNGKKKRKKKEKEMLEPSVSYHSETIKINHKESVTIKIRESKPCKQTIHLTQEAYDYMTSSESPIYSIKLKEWKNMSKKNRVRAHLLLTAHDLGGKLEDFTILED